MVSRAALLEVTAQELHDGPYLLSDATKQRLMAQYGQSLPALEIQSSQRNTNGASSTPSSQPSRMSSSPSPHLDGIHETARNLPSREVTEKNFGEAFARFILYCNPSIPLNTDTTELKKIFRSPPKSDGKTFSTFRLFELIEKLEKKELKTWAMVALELGVEPPALEKGQSAQKVQQYAVRVKRWMHALHIDAFVEYLFDKPNIYWKQVPTVNEPASERDGVAAEEDLALRALLPHTKPKRGRRKAEDREDNSDTGKSPSQRPRLESPSLSEDFAMARSSMLSEHTTPATAHPDFRHMFRDRMVPWSATDERAIPGAFDWPTETQTPMSAYPQSAITPRTQLWNDANEPRSAITPKRARRRHGPAVSSAWSSTSSGKLRGRPPSNRNVTDGPFSTFPANPVSRDIPTINLADNTPTQTPAVANSELPHFFPPEMSTQPDPPTVNGRPSRLQLQVPMRQGGAVRLATPPPVVLVNGEDDTNMQLDTSSSSQNGMPMMEYFNSTSEQDPIFGSFVSIAFRNTPQEDKDRTNMDALESHFVCEILSADWYDATGAKIERCSMDEANKICKQVIKNLKAESSSTEAFLINLSALAGGPLMTRLRMTRVEHGTQSYYECHWKMRFGSIEGDFTIRATVHHGVDSAEAEHGPEEPEDTWKKRYLDLQQNIRERDSKVRRLKTRVLDALVDSNEFASI